MGGAGRGRGGSHGVFAYCFSKKPILNRHLLAVAVEVGSLLINSSAGGAAHARKYKNPPSS